MWIQYRFHHAVQWEKGVPITGPSITVAQLENSIIAAKLSSLRRRKKSGRLLAPLHLLVYNADTGEEYGDDDEEIPANSSVIVRLLTLWSTAFLESKRGSHLKPQLTSGITKEESTRNAVVGVKGPFRSGWHYLKTPPPGYVCHRCHVPGHYIQACPMNGDPNYDIKGTKYATGGGESTTASDKNVLSSTVTFLSRRYPEVLDCPLCKEAMKEAVMMRCCFSSFCDKCIRDRIISRSICACGARNVCLDDLIPNKTLRETIKRLVPSASYTSENDRSCCLQASGSGTGYSETAACLACVLESAPTELLREPVPVRGVSDHYSVTSAPLSSTLESALTGGSRELAAPCGVYHSMVRGASKQVDSPLCITIVCPHPCVVVMFMYSISKGCSCVFCVRFCCLIYLQCSVFAFGWVP